MKRFFVVVFVAVGAFSATAQVTRGITAGYHLADVRVSFNPLIDPTFTPVATGRAGYHVGGFYRASAGLLYVQPQAWLTGLNQQFVIEDGSFTPEVLAAEIKKHLPNFSISYTEDDPRQAIANSWPQSIDDSVARRDWGWKEEFDLARMTKDMLENLPPNPL